MLMHVEPPKLLMAGCSTMQSSITQSTDSSGSLGSAPADDKTNGSWVGFNVPKLIARTRRCLKCAPDTKTPEHLTPCALNLHRPPPLGLSRWFSENSFAGAKDGS